MGDEPAGKRVAVRYWEPTVQLRLFKLKLPQEHWQAIRLRAARRRQPMSHLIADILLPIIEQWPEFESVTTPHQPDA